jgi:hypothetical protein
LSGVRSTIRSGELNTIENPFRPRRWRRSLRRARSDRADGTASTHLEHTGRQSDE